MSDWNGLGVGTRLGAKVSEAESCSGTDEDAGDADSPTLTIGVGIPLVDVIDRVLGEGVKSCPGILSSVNNA